MGHERIGALPRSKRWISIIQQLETYPATGEGVAEIASQTLGNVREEFYSLETDPGVQAAFKSLVILSVANQLQDPTEAEFDLPEHPSLLSLSSLVHRWTKLQKGNSEHRQLASQAATDALVDWHKRHKKHTGELFDTHEDPYQIWRDTKKGGGFSELAHSFFANLTERYLNYFLEREASATIDSVGDRDRFQQEVSRHANETAKIAKSFAAGWFNNQAEGETPHDEEISSFLRVAFGKLREELLREARKQ